MQHWLSFGQWGVLAFSYVIPNTNRYSAWPIISTPLASMSHSLMRHARNTLLLRSYIIYRRYLKTETQFSWDLCFMFLSSLISRFFWRLETIASLCLHSRVLYLTIDVPYLTVNLWKMELITVCGENKVLKILHGIDVKLTGL